MQMTDTPTLETTPKSDPKARILEQKPCDNGIVVYLENARFRGSRPLSGFFQIPDDDGYIWQEKDGSWRVAVLCSWHGTDADEELLELELADQPQEIIIGWDDNIVTLIGS